MHSGNLNEVFADKGLTIPCHELKFHDTLIFTRDVSKVCLVPMHKEVPENFESYFKPILKKSNISAEILSWDRMKI